MDTRFLKNRDMDVDMDTKFLKNRDMDVDMDTEFSKNRDMDVDMDTKVLKNRDTDVDMDTRGHRCPPTSVLNSKSYSKIFKLNILRYYSPLLTPGSDMMFDKWSNSSSID